MLLRWRAEILLGLIATELWRWLGLGGLGLVAVTMAVLVAFVPSVRRAAAGLVRTVVVPHRVRSGLVQAGVADRTGSLPWIVWARPLGEGVLIHIWLRSGTTVHDVKAALPVIEAACGAAKVEVVAPPLRPDRAVLAVHRPRWGWPISR